MIRRSLLTLATALGLTGLYGAYAAITRPLLALPLLSVPAAATLVETEPPRPVENVRVAETYLSHQEWAANARYLLRSQKAFLFANDWQPEGNEGRIRLRPFALVWLSTNTKTREEEAVVLVSESAVVKFAGSFEMPSPDPGRVISAALEGRTQVTGPNGLLIDGKNFFFSESALGLWSDNDVVMNYGGSGASAKQLQIDLIPQVGLPDGEKPHIHGIRNVRLSRNVIMDLRFKQKKDEPLALKVKCGGSFDFDVERQTATFSSRNDRRSAADKNDVVAFRQTGKTEFDWIECHRLGIQFSSPQSEPPPKVPAGPKPATYQKLETTLRFRSLVAEAAAPEPGETTPPAVKLYSNENKLQAQVKTLTYDGEQRLLKLSHPEKVRIVQGTGRSVLEVPEVVVQLGESDRLASATCTGPGWIVHRDDVTGQVDFAADWQQMLRHSPDPSTGLDLLELHETASFRQPANGSALGAELIRLWMKPPAPKEESKSATPPLGLAGNVGEIEFERLEATRDVVFVSPDFEARCQTLQGWLDRTLPPVAQTSLGLKKSESATTTAGVAESTGLPERTDQPMSASADQIRIRLRPGHKKLPELADLWSEGHVTLKQPHANGAKPMTLTGDRLHVENTGGNQQVAHLVGSPAQVRDTSLYLEAGIMHVDRADNRLSVDGKGLLQLPVSSDLDGKPLPKPQPLDILWQDRMSFDGKLASFVGNTSAVLGHLRVNCQTMQVTLTDKVRFDSPPKDPKSIQLASVYCRDEVRFQNSTYEGAKLIEDRRAEVWELRVDRGSGEIHAQGPGVIQMWRRGKGPRTGLVPTQAAKANSAMQIDTAEWQFTRIKFDGTMDGNLIRRDATFRDRVEIVHGPVQLPKDEIVRDKLPKRGGFMKCDALEVSLAAVEGDKKPYVQLAGVGRAEIEGQDFYAKADQITFDETRGTYMLRGFGKNSAQLWQRTTTGEMAPPAEVQRMEFNPETNTFRLDGVSGAEGAR